MTDVKDMIAPEVGSYLDSTLTVAYPALSRESNALRMHSAQQIHQQSTQEAEKNIHDDAKDAKDAQATARSSAKISRARSRAIGSVLRLVHENSLLPPPVEPKQDADILAP